MTTTLNDLLDRAEWLCRTVAGPDLGEVPLYIVPQSALPTGQGRECADYGFTTPSLDLYLQPHIADWRGRGACMVINDMAIREDRPAHFEPTFLACVVHELAHIIDRPSPYRPREGAAVDLVPSEASQVFAIVASPPPAQERIVPWLHHGPKFIRIVVHLCARAELAGFELDMMHAFHGPNYGVSHAMRYGYALGDEPERMLGRTFREICRTDPPEKFSLLWAADTAAWLSQSLNERNAA